MNRDIELCSDNIIKKNVSFDKVKYQFLAACCANIVVLGQGCAIGWLSPILPLLRSDDSPLQSGKITIEEASWIGSISSIGSVVGTIYFGLISIYFGCKNTLVFCAFPVAIFWLFVIFATNAWHLCAGRFIQGLTAGAFLCVQLYLADIASDRIRGILGTLLTLSVNIGILIGYIGGTYLSYTTVPYILMIFPILFICIFVFMPNTPQYYLNARRNDKAEKSLRFYRGCKSTSCYDNVELQQELSHMSAINKQKEIAGRPTLSDFFNKPTMKAMLIGPTLMAVSQFSGTFCLTNYSVTIFEMSGSNYSPHMSSIVFGCLQIVGTYVTTLFIDRVGRKVLLLISGSGSAVGLTVMGIFSYLFESGYDVSGLNWVPVVSLSFVIFIASIGLIPIPYVIIAEVLPQKIRLIGTTICTTTVSLWAAIILNQFPYLLVNLHLYGCMWLFASVAIFGLLFTIFFVPETKGKTLDVLLDDIECNNNQKVVTIS